MKKDRSLRLHYLMLVPGVGFILFFIGISIFLTVAQSFSLFSITGRNAFTLANWKIVAARESIDSVLFSLKMGVLSSVFTVLVAFPVALFFRKGGTGKRFLGSLIKIPLFIPALVAAFLIVNLISYHGILNETLMALHLIREPLRMLNDPFGWGVVFIQVWKNLPFVLLILMASLAGIRDDTVDAARNLGAGTWSVVFRIYVPLAMSGILVSMILMFIKAFGDFPITSVAGPIYPSSIAFRMYATATMFQQWDQAAVLGVIIIVTALFVVWAYSRLAEFVQGSETSMQGDSVPLHLRQARRRKGFYILVTAFFILVQIVWIGLPILMTVLWSLVNPEYPWSYPDLFPRKLGFNPWVYVFKYTNIRRALATSYSIAPLAVALSFLLALPTSYVLGRKNFPGKKFFNLVVLLPIIMPGMVVALSLSRVFTAIGLSQSFFGLIVAHTLMGLPYMIRVLSTSFQTIPQDVIDAAENLGATTFVKIKDIFLPMVLPGLLAGMIFAFTTSIEEFNLTYVIGTPTFETIPTILYSFMGYNLIRTNASVVALVMMTPNIVMLFLVERFLKSDYLSASLGKM